MTKKAKKQRLSTVDALERNPSGRRTIIRNDFTSGSVRTTHGGNAAVQPQAVPAKTTKRSQKGRIKSSTVAIYASVFVLLVSVIAVGYKAPEQSAAGTANVAPLESSADQPAVNDVVATDIAAAVATTADLAVAPNVNELAVSTRVQSEFKNASTDTSAITKPAIIELSAASRNIATHKVKAGETVQDVAALYDISPQTVRWANDLTGDALSSGKVLDILPIDGIVYTAQSGDTVSKIAKKYKADASLITTYNDLEVSGLKKGLKIIIPDGVLPQDERPGYVAPVQTASTGGTFITGYSAGFSGGKTWNIGVGTPNKGRYAPGNCTAYAFDRRAELGRPIGAMWGNAGTWAMYAQREGYTVNKTPAAGAVIQDWGHVAIVEAVRSNGDLELSEMNAAVPGGGYNLVSGRILPASQVGQYMYIH